MIQISLKTFLLSAVLFAPLMIIILKRISELAYDGRYPAWDEYDGPIMTVLLYSLWGLFIGVYAR